MNNEIIRDILKDYDKKRLKSKSDLEYRKKELYDMVPELKEIDKEISLISIDISKYTFSKPEDYQEKISKLKEELQIIKKKRNNIYTKNNIPLNYLEPSYECEICNDTGYLQSGDRCICFKQEIINQLYKMSNMEHMLKKENFDTFNIDIFSDNIYSGEKLSPKENMKNIYKESKKFTLNFNKTKDNLLFYGGTGLGKTFMCNCIAKELIDEGYTVVYQTSFKMFEVISNYKFRNNPDDEMDKINYQLLFNADLLIIDDLGTESNNSFTKTELFNIVNSRLISGKNTIISTNLPIENLGRNYTDRIVSRVLNNYIGCKFYGKDLRWER
ncbi:MAG: ATP-binding protein [Bacillota bacterium]|nr:ATP-binding protein [Bacillota bacterium]